MKNLLSIVFALICYTSFSQDLQKEDFIKTKNITASVLGPGSLANLKGPSFLYFNDSCVLINFSSLGNKTMFFKIHSKRWDKVDEQIVISCYDSTKTINKSFDGSPDLSITINYDAKLISQVGHIKSDTISYPRVECYFYTKGFSVSFGHDAISVPSEIIAIKRKYLHRL